MKRLHIYIYTVCIMSVCMLLSCADDDTFSTSPQRLLTFSADTVKMDTVFSRVPTSTRTFWIYNRSGSGIRCSQVRLKKGNQTGFRVNVDGTYLGETTGFQTRNVEIRNKDSVRVFVELTAPANGKETPQLHEDELVFTLESGAEQRVNLMAYTWDAQLLKNVVVSKDTLIGGDKPTVIYGGMKVDSAVTLRIAAGTTLYFHGDAALDVYGTLVTEGTASRNVVLRGDRTDRMFDYLPYDMVSGQWKGIRFHASSFYNVIDFTDIHGTYTAIDCDSTDASRQKLTLSNSIVHNCQGGGVVLRNAKADISNCQISNVLTACLAVTGGDVFVSHCTLAQFYPFDSNRYAALHFEDSKAYPLRRFLCVNSLVTGYADNVVFAVQEDTTATFNYQFVSSILRTPTPKDTSRFRQVVFEDMKQLRDAKADGETVTGDKHFRLADLSKQRYDFRLDSISTAIDKAAPEYALPRDRDGAEREGLPDIGCYEYRKNEAKHRR